MSESNSNTKSYPQKHSLKKRLPEIIAAVIITGLVLLLSFFLVGCANDSADTTDTTKQGNNYASSTKTTTSETNTKVHDNTNTNGVISAPQNLTLSDVQGKEFSSGIHHAKITVEGYDPFTVALNADAAPVSVYNFATLANSGFYNGRTFYRFQDGFCMQGGSENDSATASLNSPYPTIVGEFSENDVENPLADDFKRGTVAMARSTDPDSASTTFFVTMGSDDMVSMSLNGKYAAFGTINDRDMEIVDKIMADHVMLAKPGDMMGIIDNPDDMAKITSVEIID